MFYIPNNNLKVDINGDNISIELIDSLKIFKCVLPKKITTRGYMKYNNVNLLLSDMVINGNFNITSHPNQEDNKIYILFNNIVFTDGKVYNSPLTLTMDEHYEKINIDLENLDTPEKMKDCVVRQNNFINYLSNRIDTYLEEIESLKSKYYGPLHNEY